MIDRDKRAFGGWWLWVLALSALSAIALTALSYAGLFGRTVIERKIFENSYQYQQGNKERSAIMEAQLAEIRGKLSAPGLDATTRANLEAQASATRIQLNAARSVQN